MPDTIPITEVTAGTSSFVPYGTRLENVSPGFTFAGLPPAGAGRPIVYRPDDTGILFLDLVGSYTPPFANAASLPFGGDSQHVLVLGTNVLKVGTATIYNAAFAAYPSGITYSPDKTLTRVYDAAASGGAVDLDLVGGYTPPLAHNVPFYFGTGALVVGRVSAGASSVFGLSSKVNAPLSFTPVWVPYLYGVGRHLVYDAVSDGGAVDFSFVSAYEADTSFPFGASLRRFLQPLSVVSGRVGTSAVENAAQALYPVGIAPSRMSRAFRFHFYEYSLWEPDNGNLSFHFSSPYDPQTAQNVAFYFSAGNRLTPHGVPWTVFGVPFISHLHRTVSVISWPSSWVGSATAENTRRLVYPAGAFSFSNWGVPSLYSTTNEVYLGGLPSRAAIGDHAVALLDKAVSLKDSGIASSAFGQQYVAFYYQVLPQSPPGWEVQTAFGTGKIEYLNRPIDLDGLGISAPFLYAPRVSREIELFPQGWESSQVSLLNECWPGRPVRPETFVSSSQSLYAGISFYTRYLSQGTTPSLSELGIPATYNLRQYVECYHDVQDVPALVGVAWVENVNRVVQPFGWRTDRFAYYPADVQQPYQVIAEGIAPSGVTRPIQIDFRIRYRYLEGWQSPYMDKWHVVYNTAKEVHPAGIASLAEVDRPEEVLNLNRTFRMHWVLDSMEFGDPMVAYRVRKVLHWFPYRGHVVGADTEPRFNPYPILPAGIDEDLSGDRYATPMVEERFTIARCWGIQPGDDFVSPYAVVENRNKTLFQKPFLPQEYGKPWVTHYVRYLYPTAEPSSLFGRNAIGDNKQYPRMSPASGGAVVGKHRVEYTVVLFGTARRLFHNSGNPWDGYSHRIGGVTVKAWTLQTYGFQSSSVGSHIVDSNAIFVPFVHQGSATPPGQVGTPAAIGPRWIRYVDLTNTTLWGKPRFTPHNIYATVTPPPSAEFLTAYRANHGGVFYNPPISPSNFPYPQGTHVTLKNRVIYPHTDVLKPAALENDYPRGVLEQFGNLWASNKRRYISPKGVVRKRIGFLEVNPHTKEIDLVDRGIPPGAFGAVFVGHPWETPDGQPYARGWVSSQFGTQRVENWIRNVYPALFVTPNVITVRYSYTSFNYVVSTPFQDTQPPTVVAPSYVGPKVPTRPVGIEGCTPEIWFISHRNREIFPVGEDMTDMRYRITIGNPGMIVRRATASTPAGTQIFSAESIASALLTGVPDLYNYSTFIRGSAYFTSARIAAPTVAHA